MADIDSSLLLFSKEIKKKFVVALSGECADEVFGGYPWFHDTNTVLQNTFPWIRLVDEKLKYLNSDVINAIKPYEFIQTNYRNALEEVPQLSNETATQQRLRQIAYLSITRFMPTLLDRKDRMSMACGLEVRVPFSDHRLVEYVWNIPWEMKNCDDGQRESTGLYQIFCPRKLYIAVRVPTPKHITPFITIQSKTN